MVDVFEYKQFQGAAILFPFFTWMRHRSKLHYPFLCICKFDTSTKDVFLKKITSDITRAPPRKAIPYGENPQMPEYVRRDMERMMTEIIQYEHAGIDLTKDEIEQFQTTTTQYIMLPFCFDDSHMNAILIDTVRKEIIVIDPMNDDKVDFRDNDYRESSWNQLNTKYLFVDYQVQQCIKKIFPKFSSYKYISLRETLLECHYFITKSRTLADKERNSKSEGGYCIPFSFYILHAILTYRDQFKSNSEPCLKHLIKHFVCHPQLHGVESFMPYMMEQKYLIFLAGHTELQFDVDTEEHKFIHSNPTLSYVAEKLKKDFTDKCRSSTNPWNFFNLCYCQTVIIEFRNKRCKEFKPPTYSGLGVDDAYHGWVSYDLKKKDIEQRQRENIIKDFNGEIEDFYYDLYQGKHAMLNVRA